ncbi:MAG: 30S ribosomal protein S6 [Candidatus Omnitrophica bacterium]|nr:30S ribosomal protein S6 [Candidatus Omnitrophota bacterium]
MSDTRNYQATVLLSSQITEEAASKLQGGLGELVTRHGGRVLESHLAGRKRLSYRVKKASEATYLLMKLALPADQILPLSKAADPMEGILRFFIVKETANGKTQ